MFILVSEDGKAWQGSTGALRQRMEVDGKGAKRNRSVCLTAKSWSWRAFGLLYLFCTHKEEEIVIISS